MSTIFFLLKTCESNLLCRRLTLKDYLPSVMTRFTKYKMLFEAMRKFVAEDRIESEKLWQCIECADKILRRMNEARLRKEQEVLLKQIKSNLDIQIPNDEKLQNLQVLNIINQNNKNVFFLYFLHSFSILFSLELSRISR